MDMCHPHRLRPQAFRLLYPKYSWPRSPCEIRVSRAAAATPVLADGTGCTDDSGMTTSVRGVIARAKGEPVEVTTVLVPDPGPGEALVRVQACGVCHTDLHYREGGIGEDFPYLLGHEAAGVVEAVGAGVTGVAPGDFVILNWRAVCGQCRACKRGRPWYCFATHNAAQKMTLEDGTPLSPALGIGAFAEQDPGRRRASAPRSTRRSRRRWPACSAAA